MTDLLRHRWHWILLWAGSSMALWYAWYFSEFDWAWIAYLLLNVPSTGLYLPTALAVDLLMPLDSDVPTWLVSIPATATVGLCQGFLIELARFQLRESALCPSRTDTTLRRVLRSRREARRDA